MKTSVTIYSFRKPISEGEMNVRGFIETAAGLGFKGVDLGYYWKDENDKKYAKEWADQAGVELACVITNNDFAHPEEAQRRIELDKIIRACDDARMLNVEVVRVFAGSPKKGVHFDRARKNILEGLAKAAEYAEELGLTLALENHGHLCGKVSQVKYFLEAIDSPSLKANIDIGNFFCVEEDPVKSTAALAEFAAFVHVKDMKIVHEGGERKVNGCIVGQGEVDIAGAFEALLEENYIGWLSLEYEGPEPPEIGVPKSLEHINKTLQDLI